MRLPAEVHSLADQQNGLVTVTQLRSAGVTWKHQARLIADLLVVAVRPGVIKVGPGPASSWQAAAAAVMSAGSGAALSHSSAARAHHLPVALSDSGPEVTVEVPRHPRLDGVHLHRTGRWAPGDLSLLRGVTTTSPARTLVDIVPRVPPTYLARLLDEGSVQGLWTWPLLMEVIRRVGPRPSIDTVRGLVADRLGLAGDVGLEVRVLRTLEPFRPFQVHHRITVNGSLYELDVAWPEHLVAAECDGWAVRSRSRTKFDHDRRKGNELMAAGWTVVHITSAMTDGEIQSVVFRALLAAAAGRGAAARA
ncbi:MAG TPA: hypothetical protein VG435_20640 [Acidimicrobiales bacterium]|nr:hypothetical protein [Acidimicrobiales bacterium]